MSDAVNPSEQFVFDVCQKTFLSLWCLANPQGKDSSKELCDILVVCDPHVIIVSVKDIRLKDTGDHAGHDRWTRKAVDDSIKQIKGATRWLNQVDEVIGNGKVAPMRLPPMNRRVYHRIAVAFGGRREVSISSGAEKDEPFFHVLDEQAFYLLLRHLDTVSDFTKYLSDKETFFSVGRGAVMVSEEDLLGFYLHGGRVFPQGPDMVFLGEDIWSEISAKPEFVKKVQLDQDSYVWDRFVEDLAEMGFGTAPDSLHLEPVLRILARENRFSRRLLGKSFFDFLTLAKAKKVRARCVSSLNDVGYVFFSYDSDSSLKDRENELLGRVIASVGRFDGCRTIVGIGVNVPGEKPLHGYGYILTMISSGDGAWPDDFKEQSRKIRDEMGFFKSPSETHIHEEEFPL